MYIKISKFTGVFYRITVKPYLPGMERRGIGTQFGSWAAENCGAYKPFTGGKQPNFPVIPARTALEN